MTEPGFLYPHVTSVPGQSTIQPQKGRDKDVVPGEFNRVFDQALEKEKISGDLKQIKEPLKFSAHAAQRLRDRSIVLDQATMTKVSEAVDRASAKGIEEGLVLTSDAAFIVNVKNRTVITAMDRSSMSGNVFTNIDGAVIV